MIIACVINAKHLFSSQSNVQKKQPQSILVGTYILFDHVGKCVFFQYLIFATEFDQKPNNEKGFNSGGSFSTDSIRIHLSNPFIFTSRFLLRVKLFSFQKRSISSANYPFTLESSSPWQSAMSFVSPDKGRDQKEKSSLLESPPQKHVIFSALKGIVKNLIIRTLWNQQSLKPGGEQILCHLKAWLVQALILLLHGCLMK